MRHLFRPRMAGHWHCVPRRVLAKQRGAARSRNVGLMGLFGSFFICPTLVDRFRDDGLSAGIDVHHLYGLLALATGSIASTSFSGFMPSITASAPLISVLVTSR